MNKKNQNIHHSMNSKKQSIKATNLNYEAVLLKAKELAFDALFTKMPISFYWMDRNGILLGCNDKVLQDLKVDGLENYIGKHSNDNSNKEAWENSRQVIESGKPHTYEEEHIDMEGNKIIYLSIKHPLIGESGEVIGLLGVSIDITQRKQEEKLQILAKNLAEKANAAKAEFLYLS